MKNLALILMLFVCSCGPKAGSVEKGLESYITSFKVRTGVTPKSDVRFGILEEGTAGICETWSDGYTRITIDPNYFEEISEEQREELVYHELGHCELGRDHDETLTYKAGVRIPESVMYPYVFSSTWAKVYGTLRGEYISELLSGN